ncbi:hypothetical protein CF326_g7375 [Tilletia indica]|nr:hypothetical protein CF326_g7375 [Tilletia indica]
MESVIPPKPAKRLGMPKLSIPSRPSSSASGSHGPPAFGSNMTSSSSMGAGVPLSLDTSAGPLPLSLRSHPSSSRSSTGSVHSLQGINTAQQQDSNSNSSSPSHEWHLGSGLGGGAHSNSGPPLLHIPSSHGTGTSSTYSTNATVRGSSNAGAGGAYGYGASYGGGGYTSSMYPDTVPHHSIGDYSDPASMTNDLRRAISGLSLSSSRGSVDLDSGSENAEHRNTVGGDGIGAGAGNGSGRERSVSASDSDAGRSEGGVSFTVGDLSNASSHHQAGPSATKTDTAGTNSRPSSSHSRPGIPRSHSSRTDDGGGSSQGGHDDELVLQGNLRIVSRLGEGSSGEVHKALHVPTSLMMAKKSISTSPNPDIHRQILRELLFLRTCHSPHIVKYYGAFLEEEDTQIAICMEYCEGGSLEAVYRRVMARNGRTGEKVLAKVAECVLKGLEYLHGRNIIHRDIKPSNILLTRQGQIKLCDLGVAGELVDSVAGTFTGTSYYMAPERIQGLPNYKINSDVWSLGLSLLEVASNRFPFPPEGEPPLGPFDLITYVIAMEIPQLKDEPAKGVKWSKMMRDFIERTLEKDPAKRPGPVRMISHPWIRKSEERLPQPDIAKFLAEVWGWGGGEPGGGGCDS